MLHPKPSHLQNQCRLHDFFVGNMVDLEYKFTGIFLECLILYDSSMLKTPHAALCAGTL